MKTLFAFLCVLCVFNFPVAAQDEIMRIGGGVIKALAWSPDGETLAVGSSTGAHRFASDLARIDSVATNHVRALAWSADGERLALVEEQAGLCRLTVDGRVLAESDFCADEILWNPTPVSVLLRKDKSFRLAYGGTLHDPGVTGQSAVWSPNGTQIAFGDTDTLFIWDVLGQKLVLARAGQGYGNVLDWTEDGLRLLCTLRNEIENAISLCRFDPTSGEVTVEKSLLWRHPGDFAEAHSLQVASDHFGFAVNAFGSAPQIHIFSTDGTPLPLLYADKFAIQPNANSVTLLTREGLLRQMDFATGSILVENHDFTPALSSVAWSPDGTQIAASSYGFDQFIRVWDIATAELMLSLPSSEPANQVAWTPTEIIAGGEVVTDTILARSIGVWDLDTGEQQRSADEVYSLDDTIPLTAWNRDFTHEATSAANVITIDDDVIVTAGAPELKALAWSAAADQLASLSVAGETAILEVWDTETGARVSTAVQTGVLELDGRIWWSDTGNFLLVSGRHRDYEAFSVWVYSANRGGLILRYGTPQSYPPKIAWKPDDALIAVETSTVIVFLDRVTTQPTAQQIPASYINWLDWSPDGRSLAGAGADGTIRIWDVSKVG